MREAHKAKVVYNMSKDHLAPQGEMLAGDAILIDPDLM
jgi:hypothetical protein